MSQTKAQLIEGSAASELTAAKTLLGAGSASAPSLTAIGDTNTGVFFPTADTIAFAEGGAEAMRIDSSGRVGIGSTSPGTKLHIEESSTDCKLRIISGTASDAVIQLGDTASATQGAIIYDNGADALRFQANGSERARIDSSGRLLVGTSTAQSGNLLQTFGNLGLTKTASGNQINFYGTAIEFVNRNGTARAMQFYVGANGTAPVAELSSAGTWTNASDIKNKENIQDIAYGIETVKALIPRQYDVKSNGKHAIGFVAQEVQPIIPEVVHKSFVEATQETHLGLDYGSMVAVLTKALQEAVTKIETLEAKVAALEGV
jgi:hypothetical protein